MKTTQKRAGTKTHVEKEEGEACDRDNRQQDWTSPA
jgi:hypothetical protein